MTDGPVVCNSPRFHKLTVFALTAGHGHQPTAKAEIKEETPTEIQLLIAPEPGKHQQLP